MTEIFERIQREEYHEYKWNVLPRKFSKYAYMMIGYFFFILTPYATIYTLIKVLWNDNLVSYNVMYMGANLLWIANITLWVLLIYGILLIVPMFNKRFKMVV